MLKVFQGMTASDPHYIDQLKKIWVPQSQHMKEEEESDLPALGECLHCIQGESESMAASFDRAKQFVPTRSHPSAGEHPTFETAMGLLSAPLGKVADLFRKFPNKSSSL